MKIINGRELGFMPNGTVFSDIDDVYFSPTGANGDMSIRGLNIMCGHMEQYPSESGIFNGVVHMLDYVSCTGTQVDVNNMDERTITDTDSNDYTENDWVVVYDRAEVETIIKNLKWALNGCPDE